LGEQKAYCPSVFEKTKYKKKQLRKMLIMVSLISSDIKCVRRILGIYAFGHIKLLTLNSREW